MSDKDFAEKTKEKVLDEFFGDKKFKNDIFGNRVTRSNAEVDHIYPSAKGGSSTIDNAQVLSSESNEQKGKKLSGKINNFKYVVTKQSVNKAKKKIGAITITKKG